MYAAGPQGVNFQLQRPMNSVIGLWETDQASMLSMHTSANFKCFQKLSLIFTIILKVDRTILKYK